MEVGRFEFELCHFDIGDFDAGLIAVGVERCLDGKASVGGRICNQVDDNIMTNQRLAPPVLRDMAEEAMLDLVPFASPRRKMSDVQFQADVVGQILQCNFPQSTSRTVAPAAIGGDHQLVSGVMKEHKFIRADVFSSKDEAEKFAVAKAELIIDQSGEGIFS